MENKRERLEDLREELVRLEDRRTVVHEEIEEILYELGDGKQQNETDRFATMETDVQPIVLADSAEDFYRHGDRGKNDEDQYCKISLLPKSFKCCRKFWGVLLGQMQNNELWVMHVDAWIKRSLMVHQKLLQREETRPLKRFAVMHTAFNDLFIESDWERIVKLANGSISPYPAWWEVDMVLFPICCPNNYWFLLQFNISTLEFIIFDRDYASVPDVYRNSVMKYYETNIVKFLYAIKYFGRGKTPNGVAPFVYSAKLTQYPRSKKNSALFLCMFIHKLLKNEKKENILADVSEEIVKNFREKMADVFYAKRTG